MPHKSYRKESKSDWGQDLPIGENIPSDKIKLGAILRIADATEVMAKNYNQLQTDLEMYKRWYNETK